MIKKILILIYTTLISAATIFASASGCDYTGNPLESFKNCGPPNAIQGNAQPKTDITNSG